MEAAFYTLDGTGRAVCGLCLIAAASKRAITVAARRAISTARPCQP